MDCVILLCRCRDSAEQIAAQYCTQVCEKMQVCLLCVQILLAVLAREYDWEVDLEEPLKTFPLPVPAWGAPMTFCRINHAAS